MMDPIHIRILDGEYQNLCGQPGGAISERHYIDSITLPGPKAHVKSLNMCKSCVGMIEQRWIEILKLQRDRAARFRR